ncbi:2-C-methyl-D-erythritol 2,4-cyclodiphosphate synthase [Candidatus Bipolaricaulota bacterium]|nr:2-C-methyl-D-erythritol 2,4-cyclodiphosphate synthase [Candidatus Bipolaricaulota bacterium]
MTRVGIGLDFHRLKKGERLILGGVEYDHVSGTVAHSDGDVLVHAICDAILGAAALGDIGSHFPDDDPAYEGISSIKLLEEVLEKVGSRGYKLDNVDSTLIIQKPKLGEGREEMVEKLGEVIEAPVNVKATTTEQLGFIGREEGIGAQAVATLSRRNENIDV